MFKLPKILLAIFAVLLLFASMLGYNPANALEIDVSKNSFTPSRVAIPNFEVKDGLHKEASRIKSIIKDNLMFSGYFFAIPQRAYLQQKIGVDEMPLFLEWRKIRTEFLITGTVEKDKEQAGKVKFSFRLWDASTMKEYIAKSYRADMADIKRLGNLASDDVFARITGIGKFFDSKIAYIAEEQKGRIMKKRLAIMDFDGKNQKYLTSGKHLVLTPRFDPSATKILYLGYYDGLPRVYLYDLVTGENFLVGAEALFSNISFAPRFSSDGSKIVMSVMMQGNSELFVLDLNTNIQTRITKHPAIDTSPSFSPSGDKILFSSDRSGNQHIYISDFDGSNLRKISAGSGNYATPVWSPNGDMIAFTKMQGGKFHIGVMKPNGTQERILTQSHLDESPEWSPNSRYIIFTRKEQDSRNIAGQSYLLVIDVITGRQIRLRTPTSASDPNWSSLIKDL